MQAFSTLRGETAEAAEATTKSLCCVPGCPSRNIGYSGAVNNIPMFSIHRNSRNIEVQSVQRQRLTHRIADKAWPGKTQLYICHEHFEDGGELQIFCMKKTIYF